MELLTGSTNALSLTLEWEDGALPLREVRE